MSNKLTQVDPKLVAEFSKVIKFALEHETNSPLDKHTMTAVGGLRAPGVSRIDRGIGYLQSEFIGTQLAPEVPSSPDGNELAYYPVFKKEAFFAAGDDIVSIGGSVNTSDVEMSWSSVGLDVHSHQAVAEPRELRIAAANRIDLAALKYDLAKQRVELRKEVNIATILTTAGNYGQANALTTGGTGTTWINYLASGGVYYSNPITDFFNADERIRYKIGQRGNTIFFSPKAVRALKLHPTILALIAYSGQAKNTPAAPATVETLAAIFGKDILVGEAIQTSTLNGTAFTDVWGNTSGLIYRGPASLYAPQFALTLSSAGFPKTLSYFDPNRGAEGSNVYRYTDAYKTQVFLSGAAGELWTQVG